MEIKKLQIKTLLKNQESNFFDRISLQISLVELRYTIMRYTFEARSWEYVLIFFFKFNAQLQCGKNSFFKSHHSHSWFECSHSLQYNFRGNVW